MGVLLGLIQATPTVFPPEQDRGADPLGSAAKAVWVQFIDLLQWLGGISATLLTAGIVIFVILWATGRLRRRLRMTLVVRTKGQNNLPTLVDNLLQIGIYIFAALFAFTALGADSSAFVQAFGLITAAISLSLQDVLKNFVAGIYLLAEEPFSEGDRLEVLDQVGTVERVTVRTTVIRNDKAEQVLVPNYEVFSKVVTNRSTYNLRSLTIDITGAKQPFPAVLDDQGSWLDGIEGMSKLPPKIELTKVGPDGCDLSVTVWVTPGQDLQQAVIGRLVERFPDATLKITA